MDEEAVRRHLRERIRAGGQSWALASWALLLGDSDEARRHLERGAAEARERWRKTLPPRTGLRWFSRDQALPNQNFVREHFALALVLDDERAVRETASLLRTWLSTHEDMLRRQGSVAGVGPYRYAHHPGYLDFLAALVDGGGRPTREQAVHVGGGQPSTRIACVALVERDAGGLERGLNGMLAEHAKTLERKTGPPPAVCEAAVHGAAAARRVGLPVAVDGRWSRHRVPIHVRTDGTWQKGHLTVDLLGRALWER